MTRRRTLEGAAMVVGTSVTIQVAAAIAHSLFSRVSPGGVSAIRFFLGALVLLVVARPSIRGRDSATWLGIAAYGVALAVLNLTFFGAISLIPMGLAVTFSFVAPLAMALVASRRRVDILWSLVAGAGVVILGGLDRPHSFAGVLLALGAGGAWLGVAFASRFVGRRTSRLDGLALALPVAAVITAPFGIQHLASIDAQVLGLGLVIAVVGLVIPFALELEGLRRLEPRTVALIYSIDPAVATTVAFIGLGEIPSGIQVAGIAAVMLASAATTGAAASGRPDGFGSAPKER